MPKGEKREKFALVVQQTATGGVHSRGRQKWGDAAIVRGGWGVLSPAMPEEVGTGFQSRLQGGRRVLESFVTAPAHQGGGGWMRQPAI